MFHKRVANNLEDPVKIGPTVEGVIVSLSKNVNPSHSGPKKTSGNLDTAFSLTVENADFDCLKDDIKIAMNSFDNTLNSFKQELDLIHRLSLEDINDLGSDSTQKKLESFSTNQKNKIHNVIKLYKINNNNTELTDTDLKNIKNKIIYELYSLTPKDLGKALDPSAILIQKHFFKIIVRTCMLVSYASALYEYENKEEGPKKLEELEKVFAETLNKWFLKGLVMEAKGRTSQVSPKQQTDAKYKCSAVNMMFHAGFCKNEARKGNAVSQMLREYFGENNERDNVHQKFHILLDQLKTKGNGHITDFNDIAGVVKDSQEKTRNGLLDLLKQACFSEGSNKYVSALEVFLNDLNYSFGFYFEGDLSEESFEFSLFSLYQLVFKRADELLNPNSNNETYKESKIESFYEELRSIEDITGVFKERFASLLTKNKEQYELAISLLDYISVPRVWYAGYERLLETSYSRNSHTSRNALDLLALERFAKENPDAFAQILDSIKEIKSNNSLSPAQKVQELKNKKTFDGFKSFYKNEFIDSLCYDFVNNIYNNIKNNKNIKNKEVFKEKLKNLIEEFCLDLSKQHIKINELPFDRKIDFVKNLSILQEDVIKDIEKRSSVTPPNGSETIKTEALESVISCFLTNNEEVKIASDNSLFKDLFSKDLFSIPLKVTELNVNLESASSKECEENKKSELNVNLESAPSKECEENKKSELNVNLESAPSKECEENKKSEKTLIEKLYEILELLDPSTKVELAVSAQALSPLRAYYATQLERNEKLGDTWVGFTNKALPSSQIHNKKLLEKSSLFDSINFLEQMGLYQIDDLSSDSINDIKGFPQNILNQLFQKYFDKFSIEIRKKILQELLHKLTQEDLDKLSQENIKKLARGLLYKLTQGDLDKLLQEDIKKLLQELLNTLTQEDLDKLPQENIKELLRIYLDKFPQELLNTLTKDLNKPHLKYLVEEGNKLLQNELSLKLKVYANNKIEPLLLNIFAAVVTDLDQLTDHSFRKFELMLEAIAMLFLYLYDNLVDEKHNIPGFHTEHARDLLEVLNDVIMKASRSGNSKALSVLNKNNKEEIN